MFEANESSTFAYNELVQLARVDRRVTRSEQRLLDRFAQHLGISPRKANKYRRACRGRTGQFPEDPQQQLILLKMLARVAYSDGEMQPEERRFFDRLTSEFAISKTRLAHVLEEAEANAHRHKLLDKRWLCVALALLALVSTVGWIWSNNLPEEMASFKELDGQIRPALLLVHTRYKLDHPSEPSLRYTATGTGFFASEDGLVITNKHVIQPWRFQGKSADRLAQGYVLDPDEVETFAWREDDQVLRGQGQPNYKTAFRTSDKSLEVVRLAPDAELPLKRRPEHLRRLNLFIHANDNGDIAILRCAVDERCVSATLAEQTDDIQRLDPIMVLGYPRGLHLLETSRAVSSPTLGRVRKNEATIYVSAPVVGGNSGGPLIDRHGDIIGIATRTSGSDTLACCLRIDHARTLLEGVR